VVDDTGAEVLRVPLGEGLGTGTAGPNRYCLGYTGAMPSDGYTMTVTVEAGSPDLADDESLVYARNAICELEAVPAMLWGSLAWIAGVPAALPWIVVAVRSVRWPTFQARTAAGTNQP
jgi:hypothetical protein